MCYINSSLLYIERIPEGNFYESVLSTMWVLRIQLNNWAWWQVPLPTEPSYQIPISVN